jgi:hypothetical protein
MSARDDYPTLANHALGKLQFVSVSDAGAITAALDEIDHLRAELAEWHKVRPVVHTIGGITIRHGERDDSELCLCGHDTYCTCPDWLNDGSIGHLTLRVNHASPM